MEKDNLRIKRLLVLLAAILIDIAIGYADTAAIPHVSFLTFYLVPVLIATWFASAWAGMFVLSASLVVWFIPDAIARGPYSHGIIPYWEVTVKFVILFVVVCFAATAKRLLDNEKVMSRTDYLTGAANRRYFFEIAAAEARRAARYKRPITLAYVDIDNLKGINDQYGHKTGDRLIRLVAETVKKGVRMMDMVARVGGDEFILMMPETGYDASQTVIHRIHKELQYVMEANKWPTTFSIGAVTCESVSCHPEVLITMADNLMYSAKRAGKNMIKHEILKEEVCVSP
ncbi:MAG: GGDEF domain-containing protein [Candidatus Omnitrophica bacterium]|nr:GGDEF domain-containing protein [Candidatus Omnitrophota bacterium]